MHLSTVKVGDLLIEFTRSNGLSYLCVSGMQSIVNYGRFSPAHSSARDASNPFLQVSTPVLLEFSNLYRFNPNVYL